MLAPVANTGGGGGYEVDPPEHNPVFATGWHYRRLNILSMTIDNKTNR